MRGDGMSSGCVCQCVRAWCRDGEAQMDCDGGVFPEIRAQHWAEQEITGMVETDSALALEPD